MVQKPEAPFIDTIVRGFLIGALSRSAKSTLFSESGKRIFFDYVPSFWHTHNDMNKITVGTDLVDIDRLRRALEDRSPALGNRLFTPREWTYSQSQAKPHASLAARMAAKEAIRKIFGQWGYDDVNWRETEVVVKENGAPFVVLHGRAAERAKCCSFALSLAHTDTLAQAFCIAYDNSPND